MIVVRMIREEMNSRKDYYVIEDVMSSFSSGEFAKVAITGNARQASTGGRILK